jgi:FkbM family methyltransferase
LLTVEVQPLDRLLSSNPSPIALLKIDVEGYERFVVEGAIHTLARTASVYDAGRYSDYGIYDIRTSCP